MYILVLPLKRLLMSVKGHLLKFPMMNLQIHVQISLLLILTTLLLCVIQGYDGASNMRGEWNGLQALFMKDCPYAYYVHCQAHQLQLALIVAAAREVFEVHDFFKDLIFIVNVVSPSSKCHDELQDSQIAALEHLIEIEDIENRTRLNQIDTLQCPGHTRWSSHYR